MPAGPDGPLGPTLIVAVTAFDRLSMRVTLPPRWFATQTDSAVTSTPSGFKPTSTVSVTRAPSASIRRTTLSSKLAT